MVKKEDQVRNRLLGRCNWAGILGIIVLAQGCASIDDTKPVVRHLPPPPQSYIFVPIDLPVATIKDLVEKQIASEPVARGESPPVNGSIATEAVVKMVKVKRIISLAREESRKVTTLERIGLGLFSGGLSEVTKVVVDHIPEKSEIIEFVDKGQAISDILVNRYTKVISTTIEARYVVHYTGRIKNIDSLTIDGDQLRTSILLDWDISADLLSPLPVGASVKGALTTKGSTVVDISAKLSTDNNAKLNISLNRNGTKVAVKSLELPGLGINLVQLIPVDASAAMTVKTLAKVFELIPENELLQPIVEKSDRQRTFGNRIRSELVKLGRPLLLGTNVLGSNSVRVDAYLDIAPTNLAFGNAMGTKVGERNVLRLPVELTTPVRLVLSDKKPIPFQGSNPNKLPISTTAEVRRLVDIQLVTDLAVTNLTMLIDREIYNAWTNSLQYVTNHYEPGPTSLWCAKDDKYVLRLPIRKKNSVKDWTVLYAWANAAVIEEPVGQGASLKSLQLTNIEWTARSKNILVTSLAWLGHPIIQKKIEDRAHLSLAKLENEIQTNGTRTFTNNLFVASVGLKSHKFQGLSLGDGYFRFALHAKGEPTISFK